MRRMLFLLLLTIPAYADEGLDLYNTMHNEMEEDDRHAEIMAELRANRPVAPARDSSALYQLMREDKARQAAEAPLPPLPCEGMRGVEAWLTCYRELPR